MVREQWNQGVPLGARDWTGYATKGLLSARKIGDWGTRTGTSSRGALSAARRRQFVVLTYRVLRTTGGSSDADKEQLEPLSLNR